MSNNNIKNTSAASNFDLTPADLAPMVEFLLSQGKVPLILGPVGVGKSTNMAQIASKYKRTLHDVRLSNHSPSDITGYPFLKENMLHFAQLGLFPTDGNSLLFLDEISLAAPETIKQALQLTLDRRVGDYELPEGTWVVLAGNRIEDRCMVEKMSPALYNRVVTIRVRPDKDSFLEYAAAQDVHPAVRIFIETEPALLHNFDARKWSGEGGFASPRAWFSVSDQIKSLTWANLPARLQTAALVGTVGQEAGIAFQGFLSLQDQLPTPEEIAKNPEGAPLPNTVAGNAAAVAMLVQHASQANGEAFMTYVNRLSVMYQAFFVRSVVIKFPSLIVNKVFKTWITANVHLYADLASMTANNKKN